MFASQDQSKDYSFTILMKEVEEKLPIFGLNKIWLMLFQKEKNRIILCLSKDLRQFKMKNQALRNGDIWE
jgi:hypothetical protein